MEPESANVPEYLQDGAPNKQRRRQSHQKGDTKKKASEEQLHVPTSPAAAFFLGAWVLEKEL